MRGRAYPDSLIDPMARLRALVQLEAMRDSLHPFIPPPGYIPGTPLAGTQPCTWRSIGPTNVYGRVTGIAVDPTNRDRVFVATVGGIWRSTDRGRSWERVSDKPSSASSRSVMASGIFGAVAINPASPGEVIAGGGDPNAFDHFTEGPAGGPGLWRSTDQGKPESWRFEGPEALTSAVIYRIRIGPTATNNDVYVASSIGIWKGVHDASGGIGWSRLAGRTDPCSDVVVDYSHSPPIVLAGVLTPEAQRGIQRFRDGAWTRVWDGTGSSTWRSGAIALALAPSDPSVIYAKIENEMNGALRGIYVSTNGGDDWTRRNSSDDVDDCEPYTWYNNVIEVDPGDPNKVYVGGIGLFRATRGGLNPPAGSAENGGLAWKDLSENADPDFSLPLFVHDDVHAIAFDPVDSNILWAGNDGGLAYAEGTDGSAWHWIDRCHGMTITQFYAIASQRGTLSVVSGGSQDNGTEITFGNRTWYAFPGCDAPSVALDAAPSSALYQGCLEGVDEMVNPVAGTADGGQAPSWPAGSEQPFLPVVSDPTGVGQALASRRPAAEGEPVAPLRIVKTTDGRNWLTTSDVLPVNTEVTCIAIGATCVMPPPDHFCSYYVGFADTLALTPSSIWSTQDGGASWVEDPSGLPGDLSPNAIVVDPFDSRHAFAGFGGQGHGAVLVTMNHGRDWRGLVATGDPLPDSPIAAVAFDPSNNGVIYVASGVGVFQGEIGTSSTSVLWTPFDEGLPYGVDVTGIAVNHEQKKLVISTMGYGAFERDVSPGATCPEVLLTIRDNVFDTGIGDSPNGQLDPEHPIADLGRPPGFFEQSHDLLHWWTSSDIRIQVPELDPPRNRLAPDEVDPVAMESCPTDATLCPPGSLRCPSCSNGTLFDQDPRRNEAAEVYVQVTNRGTRAAHDLRVVALWADATAGLPLLAGDFWTTALPATGGCSIPTASSAWQILPAHGSSDCSYQIDVLGPGEAKVAAFDWDHVPVTAATHSCMLAMVESPDDPIDPTLRSGPALRPHDFVQSNHQIGLRNLHVVDGTTALHVVRGTELLSVTNPTPDTSAIDIEVSRYGMRTGRIDLRLPHLTHAPHLQNVLIVHPSLTRAVRKAAELAGVDTSRTFRILGSSAVLEGLHIPPGRTWRVQLEYDTGLGGRSNTVSRFTVLTRKNQKILGGSTWVLRIR